MKSNFIASLLVSGIVLSPLQAQNVRGAFEDLVLNCLNWPLRWFSDDSVGCLTNRTSLPNQGEQSSLHSRGLRWVVQKVNWEYRLIITKKPVEKPFLNEKVTIPRSNSSTSLAIWPNSSLRTSTNPSPYIIHGAWEISINWQKVYSSP